MPMHSSRTIQKPFVAPREGKTRTQLAMDPGPDGLRAREIWGRTDEDISIQYGAEKFCISRDAQEAVTWKYRLLSVERDPRTFRMHQDLRQADSLVQKSPMLAWIRDKLNPNRRILDDKETERFLGTSDLKRYAAETRQEVEAVVGGDYFEGYLKGTDLPKP